MYFQIIFLVINLFFMNLFSASLEENKKILYPMNLETEPGQTIRKIKWSADGLKLAVSFEGSNQLKIWNTRSHKLLKVINFRRNINNLDWSHDNNYLAICLADNSLEILKNNSNFDFVTTLSLVSDQNMSIFEVLWSKDSQYIATASTALYFNNNILFSGNKSYLHFWDFSSNTVVNKKEFLGNISSVKFSNADILAVTTTLREINNTTDESDVVNILLKGSSQLPHKERSRIYIFNPYNDSQNVQLDLNEKIADFIWLSTGQEFITINGFGKIDLYNNLGKLAHSINLENALVGQVSLSFDDKFLAYVDKNYLKVIKLYQELKKDKILLNLPILENSNQLLTGKAVWSSTEPLIATAVQNFNEVLKLQVHEVSKLFENFKTLKMREFSHH